MQFLHKKFFEQGLFILRGDAVKAKMCKNVQIKPVLSKSRGQKWKINVNKVEIL
jgi:anaerobic glycerol-3-phosphate dehydrogenase